MSDDYKRIIDYDAASEARTDDNILMDSPAVGTRKITATNLIKPATDALTSEQTARENADTNILNTLRREIAEVDDKSIASGGTTGQVLFKHSNDDHDTEWGDLVIPSNASDISYDNTQSGLTATDVQAAIDENTADITEIKSNLTNLTPKTALHNFTGLSNSSSSTYYLTLANNIMQLSELSDATTILSVYISTWDGVGNGQGAISVVLNESNKLFVLFPKGANFSNGNVKVAFTYI